MKFITLIDELIQWCVDSSAHWIMQSFNTKRSHIRFACGVIAVGLALADTVLNPDRSQAFTSLFFALVVLLNTYMYSTLDKTSLGSRTPADMVAFTSPALYTMMKVLSIVCTFLPKWGLSNLAYVVITYEVYLKRTPDEPPPKLVYQLARARR